MDVIIYHNPDCGTSRNALAMIRNAGIEPHVVEYLKTPPSRALLLQLMDRMEIKPRDLLREKGTPYADLGLGNSALTNDQLVDAMMRHPILINRPIVVSPKGVRLCRPSEAVLDLLPAQQGAFTKEDGEKVVDEAGVPADGEPRSVEEAMAIANREEAEREAAKNAAEPQFGERVDEAAAEVKKPARRTTKKSAE